MYFSPSLEEKLPSFFFFLKLKATLCAHVLIQTPLPVVHNTTLACSPALSHWSVGGKLGLGVVGSRFASTVSWLCDAGQLLISGLSMGRLACPAKQPGEFVKKFIDSISDRIL